MVLTKAHIFLPSHKFHVKEACWFARCVDKLNLIGTVARLRSRHQLPDRMCTNANSRAWNVRRDGWHLRELWKGKLQTIGDEGFCGRLFRTLLIKIMNYWCKEISFPVTRPMFLWLTDINQDYNMNSQLHPCLFVWCNQFPVPEANGCIAMPLSNVGHILVIVLSHAITYVCLDSFVNLVNRS